jgi:hypothetical protein
VISFYDFLILFVPSNSVASLVYFLCILGAYAFNDISITYQKDSLEYSIENHSKIK